ncbi:MAG: hypothetical protein GF408_08690 [Candidatus Omnitrophica bacterium]|nr:hypothetical protein [Candidatus Omnitrophota bacterium]
MKVLLHICCGVCASSVVERLMCEGYTVTGYFYGPNIHPHDEYDRRLDAARAVAREMRFDLIEGKYDRERWFEAVKGAENAPEGGKRCEICFRLRLEAAYRQMRKNMFDRFTTTLTVSPLKDAVLVNRLGREIGGDKFIIADFKKKEGCKRAVELSREMGLYRQDYCGCVYSQEEAIRSRERRSRENGNADRA